VICNGNGEQISEVWTDSVRCYVMRVLDAQNAEMKAELVALLNRGAAAQIAMGYNVDDLANNLL